MIDHNHKHAMLNSLVGQIRDDAVRIKQSASERDVLHTDNIKVMRDTATAILGKLARYEELLK